MHFVHFFFCLPCLAITAVTVKNTSTDSIQGERRHQGAPMSHTMVTMPFILLGRQGHLKESPRDKPLNTIQEGQVTVACPSSEASQEPVKVRRK